MRAGLLDTSHLHTHVPALDDDAEGFGFDVLVERICDLRREPFLDLQAPREDVNETSELAQAHDLLVRDVADMRDTHKREHVMLAEGADLDVLLHHDLVVVFSSILERLED